MARQIKCIVLYCIVLIGSQCRLWSIAEMLDRPCWRITTRANVFWIRSSLCRNEFEAPINRICLVQATADHWASDHLGDIFCDWRADVAKSADKVVTWFSMFTDRAVFWISFSAYNVVSVYSATWNKGVQLLSVSKLCGCMTVEPSVMSENDDITVRQTVAHTIHLWPHGLCTPYGARLSRRKVQ